MSSSHPSRISALITLVIVFGLIGGAVYFAWQWTTSPSPTSTKTVAPTPTNSSPDLQNITDQFDEL